VFGGTGCGAEAVSRRGAPWLGALSPSGGASAVATVLRSEPTVFLPSSKKSLACDP
jgi:hypothetical protein